MVSAWVAAIERGSIYISVVLLSLRKQLLLLDVYSNELDHDFDAYVTTVVDSMSSCLPSCAWASEESAGREIDLPTLVLHAALGLDPQSHDSQISRRQRKGAAAGFWLA